MGESWTERVLERIFEKAKRDGLRLGVDLAREGLNAIEEEYLDRVPTPKPLQTPPPPPQGGATLTRRKPEATAV